MEVKLLDAILHGELKPWKLDASNTRRFTELVKAAKAVSPATTTELQKQLEILLADYPTLQKLLAKNSFADNTAIKMLLHKAEFPNYKDPITQYYFILISALSLRFWNNFLKQSESWTHGTDIQYQVGKTLKGISVLTKQTAAELNEQGFTSIPGEQSSFIHFALYYLKQSLLQLYFSIQEPFKNSLAIVTTQEDFHLLDLEEPISNFIPLEFIGTDTDKAKTKKSKKDKFSFGFKGDKESLRSTITQLCLQLELLNDSTNTEDELMQVLTSKDLKPGSVKIHIGCETAQFRYILIGLKKVFDNFSFSHIEKANLFYSKTGTFITAQNLYSSKIDNPKTKEEIDNIIKHLK